MPTDERERQRPAVGVQPDERLEQRRGALEREGDEPDLGEGEGVGLLQHRVDGRDQGLDGVVEQVRDAQRHQDRECRRLDPPLRCFRDHR